MGGFKAGAVRDIGRLDALDISGQSSVQTQNEVIKTMQPACPVAFLKEYGMITEKSRDSDGIRREEERTGYCSRSFPEQKF